MSKRVSRGCKACEATSNPGGLHDALETCRRMKSRVRQWWERDPGYFYSEELPRELARAGREWWPRAGALIGHQSGERFRADLRDLPPPVCSMTPKQVAAELTRQCQRLAGHGDDE